MCNSLPLILWFDWRSTNPIRFGRPKNNGRSIHDQGDARQIYLIKRYKIKKKTGKARC